MRADGPGPTVEMPDEQGGLFCEVFVDTDLPAEGLERLIAELLDAAVQRQGFVAWVVGPHFIIDVRRNKRRSKRVPEPARQIDDFVEWSYYLEIDAEVGQTRPMQIAVITRLLTGLWARGLGAVAVCDFADELPQRGGYNPEVPRT